MDIGQLIARPICNRFAVRIVGIAAVGDDLRKIILPVDVSPDEIAGLDLLRQKPNLTGIHPLCFSASLVIIKSGDFNFSARDIRIVFVKNPTHCRDVSP